VSCLPHLSSTCSPNTSSCIIPKFLLRLLSSSDFPTKKCGDMCTTTGGPSPHPDSACQRTFSWITCTAWQGSTSTCPLRTPHTVPADLNSSVRCPNLFLFLSSPQPLRRPCLPSTTCSPQRDLASSCSGDVSIDILGTRTRSLE
jgi:hypothetical protein